MSTTFEDRNLNDGWLSDTLRRRDVRQLLGLALVTAIVAGWSTWDLNRKRALLDPEGPARLEALLGDQPPDAFDAISETRSGREYGWFGKHWGTVRVYARKRDDHSMRSFQGVEYYYRLEDGAWTVTDSSSVVEPRHRLEAYTAFEEAGYKVDENAYLLR